MHPTRTPPVSPGMVALRLAFWGIALTLHSPGASRPAGVDAVPRLEHPGAISDKCWVFMHLQKSGGSTVKGILGNRWGSKLAVYDSVLWKEGDASLEGFGDILTSGDRWNVVVGGYTDALRRSSVVDQNCRWFTMFRHPVSRLVSAYFYCKRTPHDRACASEVVNANHVDLVAFAKHWGNFAMRQFALGLVSADDVMEFSRTVAAQETVPPSVRQVSKIPGWYLLKMYLESDEVAAPENGGGLPDAALYKMLQPVQDLLRDGYDAVGILEEFNTTLSLFDAALGMPSLSWHQEFASQGRRKKNDRYAEEKEVALAEALVSSEIKKYIQLDIVLYQHAVDVFHRQAQAYDI